MEKPPIAIEFLSEPSYWSNEAKVAMAKTTGINIQDYRQHNIHSFLEKKIVPVLVLVFAIIYWIIGLLCFFDVVKTY